MRDFLTKSRVALFALVAAASFTTTGLTIAVAQTHSLACPKSLNGVHIGAKPSQLVPSTPDRAVFCKYAGMNEKVKSGTLVRVVVVRNPSALAKLLNQAKPIPKGAVYPCPADLGGRAAIVFAKAAKTTTVIIPTSGCPFVGSTNTAGRWFLSSAAYFGLQKLDPIFRP